MRLLLQTMLLFTTVALNAQVPSNCRIYLAGQFDWQKSQGFYIDFEGAKLSELPLILGVADGNQWQFISYTPGFEFNTPYHLNAVICNGRCSITIDDVEVATMNGSYKPINVPLDVAYKPSWANDKGDWVAQVKKVRVAVENAGQEIKVSEFDLSKFYARPTPLQMFDAGSATNSSMKLELQPEDKLIVDVWLEFESPDLQTWAPFIDAYGQCRYAEFPEKISSDEQLKADITLEEERLAQMPPSKDFNQYGGWLKAGWSAPANGFYQVTQHEGKWWLITPEGNPCFYIGVSAVPASQWETTPVSEREFLFEWLPPKEEPWAACWSSGHWGGDSAQYACLHAANLIKKYGDGWSGAAIEQAHKRLAAWGFHGAGKWGSPASFLQILVIGQGATPKLVRHVDIFDPAMRELFRNELDKQIASRRNEPMLLGWSFGNEYDEIVTPDEIVKIIAMPETTPARQALIAYAVETIYGQDESALQQGWKGNGEEAEALAPPAEDIEKLRQFYADQYYKYIYETIKELDPNHLFFGNWIVPTWWVNESDWELIGRHCDVIGYDYYSRNYPTELIGKLQAKTGKPTFIGEFSFPAWYEGNRGFGRFPAWAKDDAESGELYYNWMKAAAEDPYCVGMLWFFYRDQALTGRGPGTGVELYSGEHYAFGLITETDKPKWDMVEKMREANLNSVLWRSGAKVE